MRAVLTRFFALFLFSGCWTAGDIQENLPRHTSKFPPETVFYVEKTEGRVRQALVDALGTRGFKVVKSREKATVAVVAKIVSWEYNDAGFSGFYERDQMTIAIHLEQVATGFILARHTVTVDSDFNILASYVEML